MGSVLSVMPGSGGELSQEVMVGHGIELGPSCNGVATNESKVCLSEDKKVARRVWMMVNE